MDRCRTRIEITHQVENAVTNTGGIDADVLHVEALGELFDLGGLVREGVPTPAVFLQDPEPCARLQRWGDNHAGGIVTGAAGIVADPHRGIAEGAIGFRVGVEVCPERLVRVAALQVRQAEGPGQRGDRQKHFAHPQPFSV